MKLILFSALMTFSCVVCSNDLQTDKDALLEAELMTELEVSLSKVNDSEVMDVYQGKSSGIDLLLGGSPLNITKRDLISNVTSVSGATSIISNASGFGFTIGLSGDYLFEFDEDALTLKAQEALKSVLTLYRDFEGTSILVEGHTDAKGTDEYNLDLSKRRANTVKLWFEAEGIDSALITTEGYGETKPIAENTINGEDNPEGRKLNRRVEIIVKTKKKVNHLPTVSKSTTF